MSASQTIEFKPSYDAFPTTDIFKEGDACLDIKYLKLSEELFGTNVDMECLVREFKEAVKKEGLIVPGK
jgi:hypothetical protein